MGYTRNLPIKLVQQFGVSTDVAVKEGTFGHHHSGQEVWTNEEDEDDMLGEDDD